MTKRSTKRSLLLSILAILVCASMLVGTTFAWFTDSVTSAGNKIQSGTLKLDLEVLNPETNAYESIKTSKAPLFNYDKWEPGYTEVKLLKVENEGTLALKWYANVVTASGLSDLANVIDVYVLPSDTALTMPDRDLLGYTKVGTVADFVDGINDSTKGTLLAGESAYLGLALKMQESAGNEYQNKSLAGAFDIQILATQLTYEKDSFNDQYDASAAFPIVVNGNADGNAALILEAKDNNDNVVVEVTVPETAPVGKYELNVSEPMATVKDGKTGVALNITLLKDGVEVDNPTPGVKYPVTVNVGAGQLIDTVLHNSEEITVYTYDYATGDLTFETDSFSPFAVLFKVIPESAVAKLVNSDGSVEFYDTIAEAYADANDGATITAIKDMTLTETAVLDKDISVVLDLDSYTVSGALTTLLKITDGNVTIKGGNIKNVHAAATDTKYSIYMAGDAVAKIENVNIETTGVGIWMEDNSKITELNANVDSYLKVNGYCTYDAVSLNDNARIDLISGGHYESYYAEEFIQAWYESNPKKLEENISYTINVNGDGASIGEIRDGIFLGVFDKANNGTPIRVNAGKVEFISGGYFGFAKTGLSNPYNTLFVNSANNASIGKITGGRFEHGSSKNGFNCDFAGIVDASDCQVVETGETVDVNIQFSTKVTTYTLKVVEVVAK